MAKTYRTVSGDTWDIISLKMYGSELFTTELVRANFSKCSTVVFAAGVVVNVPAIDTGVRDRTNQPPWRRRQ
jgi:phage tail protein X